jgi:hypothetical protein
MKLYTEEQVIKMLEVCRDSDLYEHILTFEDILKTETAIELPNDEEIDEHAIFTFVNRHNQMVWIEGAKWMRDKIQGGNNDQQ